MKAVATEGGNLIAITDDPPIVNCKPAVDYLFQSVAEIYGSATLGVILTGMGSDGTNGCKLLKQKNAMIVAQDKESCVVYGMPKQVIEAGLADWMTPLDGIATRIRQLVEQEATLCK